MFNHISTNEKQFLLTNLIKNSFREVRRGLEDYREISLKKLDENGQVEVRLGETLVISQIFAKLISPSKDRPNEGVVVFSIDSNNLRPNAEYTQSNEDLNEMRNKLNNLLDKTLRESKALDTNSLCIIPGVLIWKIVIDINIINNDGNLYDACTLASLASWMIFRVPFLKKSGDRIEIPSNPQYINLSTLHVPLSVTFGLFDNNTKFLVDPSLKEEKSVDGFLIVSANKFAEICYMHTYGSVQIEREAVTEFLVTTRSKVFHLTNILKKFVESQKVSLLDKGRNKIEAPLPLADDSNEMQVDYENVNGFNENLTSNFVSSNKKDKKAKFNLYDIKNN